MTQFFIVEGREGAPMSARMRFLTSAGTSHFTERVTCSRAFTSGPPSRLDCARNSAREHAKQAQPYPTPAKRANENPSASSRLTEGLCLAGGIVRAVLFQLSYPPVSRSVGGDPGPVNRSACPQGRRP